MSDFSSHSDSVFDSIQLKNILSLISVLMDIDFGMKSVVQQRFNQEAMNFNETLSFLNTLGVVETADKEMQLKDDFEQLIRGSDKNAIQNQILDLIQKTNNPYQTEILKYLSKYRHIDGSVEYEPDDINRGEFSDVRNFLIEIGVVEYVHGADKYVVQPEHIHLFALAIENKTTYTPAKLKRKLIEKDKIGSEAELAVLKYEKDRVGLEYKKLVEHISVKNEAAGYDIKSVTVIGDNTEPRYIEVKAVSPDSYRFYWSQNEIRVAELLNQNYYLYLLPVESKMRFTINKMKIILDPIKVIFVNLDTWNVEPNVVCCSLNS